MSENTGPRHGTPWSEDRDDVLREMWGTRSAAQIAALMGGLTKSAIIGRAHRLKLGPGWLKPDGQPWFVRDANAPKSRRKTPKRKVTSPGRTTLKPLSSLVDLPPPPTPTPAVLSRRQCCWPIGEPRDRKNFRYCDAPALLGCVYCPFHEKIAYVSRRPSDGGAT